MWFDVRKLLANANFQDLGGDFGATSGVDTGGLDVSGPGSTGEEIPVPVNTAGPTVAPVDALGVGAGPATAPAGAPGGVDFGALNTTFGAFDPSFGGAEVGGPFGADPGTSGPATPDTSTTTPAVPSASPGQGGKVAPGETLGTGSDTPTPLRPGNVSGANDIGQNTGVGTNAGNPFQSLASALNGMARAAQGGNPQAQQIMNMLRQMQMQAAMNQMGGMGQGYNPYMNQMFNNPWAARMRMEMMRRRFMEQQRRLGAQPGTAAAMNPRGAPGVGGSRGRR